MLMLCKLLLCLSPLITVAQNTPKELLSTGINACAGSGVIETNAYITHQLSVTKRNLFFVNYGARFSIISTSDNRLAFKSPTNLDPSFKTSDTRMSFGSLNVHFGFRLVLAKQLLLGSSVDFLGIALGKQVSSYMTSNGGQPYAYEASVVATNFLLQGANGGNLLHTIELLYISDGILNYKIGLANQSILYEYTSTMPQYTSFARLKFAYMGMIGVEWKLPCK